jgi:DNA-binding transcriptional regulator YiaG
MTLEELIGMPDADLADFTRKICIDLLTESITGAWLRQYRTRAHLSQSVLARKLGISRTLMSQWETGKVAISLKDRGHIREVLCSL